MWVLGFDAQGRACSGLLLAERVGFGSSAGTEDFCRAEGRHSSAAAIEVISACVALPALLQ